MAGVEHIRDEAGALALAERLNSNDRARPTVVVSTPAGREQPYIDVAALCDAVDDIADIVVITTGPHTWSFSRAMPELTQVYGGAGRVYPVGTAWVRDLRQSPLRFAYGERDGAKATEHLIADAERMAAQAGLFDRAVTATPPVHFTGRVTGFPHPERAWVKSGHTLATVIPDLASPGVALERLLTKGMEVTGLFDRTTLRLDLRGARRTTSEALAPYAAGAVVLAHVDAVDTDAATVTLFPGTAVTISRQDVTSNDLDSLTDLLSPGEVLAARVVTPGPQWRLTLIDIDDDEPVLPAPSVFPGGPEWLIEPSPEAPAPAAPSPTPELVTPEALDLEALELEEAPPAPPPPAAAPRVPSPLLLDRSRPRPTPPAPAPAARAPEKGAVRDLSLTVSALKRVAERQAEEIADLTNARNLLAHDLEEAEREIRRREAEVSKIKSRLRKAGKGTPSDSSLPVFADRERGFRVAVELAWARRTPTSEQASRPLVDYAMGPDFLGSLDRLQGVSEAKVADVVFEIVTGRVHEVKGRDLHQLREGAAGNAPHVRRPHDGATCWRAALQINTPSARRIHYWVVPGGGIELSRVCLHDETEP